MKLLFVVVNYLVVNNRKMYSNSLLLYYNLSSIVHFPTRIQNNAISATDNISIYSSKLEMYILTPLSNGLSDLEAQLLDTSYWFGASEPTTAIDKENRQSLDGWLCYEIKLWNMGYCIQ
jgi:hypothetical protein